MLGLASFFEEDFSLDWIVELSGEKASQLLLAFQNCTGLGCVTSKGPGVFSFMNAEDKKKLQEQFSEVEKNQIHRRIAEILLKELSDDVTKAKTVAYHLIHSANDMAIYPWLISSAAILRRANHYEEALQCYIKVLDDLSDLQGDESDRLFIEAAINYSKVSTARHDTNKVISKLHEAIARAQRNHNQISLILLKMHLAKNEWLRSRHTSALEYFKQGWAMAQEIEDPKLLRSATTFSTFFLYWQGRFREAVNNYEKAVPDVEKYPQGSFPILATVTVAHCYEQIGQVTQGLGMLDAIRTHCRKKGDRYNESIAGLLIGVSFLNMHKLDDAFQYLKCSIKDAKKGHNDWAQILGKMMLAFAYFLNGENKRAIDSLRDFLQHSRDVQVTVQAFPYLMELSWAMEQGIFPRISGLSLKEEIIRAINGVNIFTKGVAYRYQSLLHNKEGIPQDKSIQSLELSIHCLEESGHQIELAKSQIELSRQYLSLGDNEKAKIPLLKASDLLSSFNEALIPDDLKLLIKTPPSDKDLLREILKLGGEVVIIRNNKDLIHKIISTVNRITGAERGAMFLLEDTTHPPKLRLRASKNLTSEQVSHPLFSSSMEMIKEVAFAGKGQVMRINNEHRNPGIPLSEIIRSRICVPMIVRDKLVGVLYHDNRLLSSIFKESDLELLGYFAAQAAFALDNSAAYEEIQILNEKLKEEKLYYEEEHIQSLHFEDMVGESQAIMNMLKQVTQVAATDTPVLVMGETGVGKGLVAKAIYSQSLRREKPFIRVFCSALPESLIPSELFGHEKGAFTGAINRRIGRFELADKGTLFLDEIGDLSLEVQVRLLRVLESKEFERVGGNQTIRSDFRLISATNRVLEKQVIAGQFRADLYYRLNVFPIFVPPLRERKEDIPLLVNYFLKIFSTKLGKAFKRVPKEEIDKLLHYDWPGNIRELENIIERSVILNNGPIFRVPNLSLSRLEFNHPEVAPTLKENERHHILWALQKTGWKVRGKGGAAELLSIHPSTLNFRMKKLGIQRLSKSPSPDFHGARKD